MSAGISTHIDASLKTSINIENGSDEDWNNLNVVLNKNNVFHLDKLAKKSSYNAFLWEFVPMDYRPFNSSRIKLWDLQSRRDRVKDLEKLKLFDLELYTDGGYHHQKLQNN